MHKINTQILLAHLLHECTMTIIMMSVQKLSGEHTQREGLKEKCSSLLGHSFKAKKCQQVYSYNSSHFHINLPSKWFTYRPQWTLSQRLVLEYHSVNITKQFYLRCTTNFFEIVYMQLHSCLYPPVYASFQSQIIICFQLSRPHLIRDI